MFFRRFRNFVNAMNQPERQTPISDPVPELDDPWRPVTWSDENKNQMLRKLKEFQPRPEEVRQLKILLHGPIGAGKSSFINSIDTVLQGHNTAGALADSLGVKSSSFTIKFKLHRLKKDEAGTFHPFVFADIMGLEPEDSRGVQTEDMVKILQGHIKDDYTIAEDDPKYISNPSLKDKVHCLVSVLPGDRISLISDEVLQKMREVRKKARDLGIPQVVIMSMVDKACPLVNKDLRKIYTSKKIKEKMEECSDRLGVPMNCIYPVQNYHEQVTNDVNMDILLLMAASDIIRFANAYVEDQFNPVSPIAEDDPRYISNPSLKDKVHCLVSVLPGDNISHISDEVVKKMRAVRKKARDLAIPQVVIMSMVDKACPLVNEDLRKIYTSKKIKEKMKECSDRLGVPMNCIYPVQNYHEQVTNDVNMDILILMAASDIIRFANDYVEGQVYRE